MNESDPVPDVAALMADLARELHSHSDDMSATLHAIALAAVKMVPGAEQASITRVVRNRRVITDAATGDVARALDQIQEELGHGPCMEAEWLEPVLSIPDLRAETRWPDFAHRAVDLDVGSMLCLQMYVGDDELGALNLHATATHRFDDESIEVGQLFAAHAAVAVVGAERASQFQDALRSRDEIGQAKGMLMSRYGLTEGLAFGVLARTSQQTNTKLIDVARHLIATGKLEPTDRVAP